MKTFYFIYGFISAITLTMLVFNNYADTFLDDYYIEKLYHEWYKMWNLINLTINMMFTICSIIWIYVQGMVAAKELTKKETEEENE